MLRIVPDPFPSLCCCRHKDAYHGLPLFLPFHPLFSRHVSIPHVYFLFSPILLPFKQDTDRLRLRRLNRRRLRNDPPKGIGRRALVVL
jgi:hypothetical protein